jgi:hypothetical protein
MNKNIMYCFKSLFKKRNEQIVVLLGAGAAIPWDGVKTSDIRNIFVRDTDFGNIDEKTVGQYLFDILDSSYGHPNTNFEEFIVVLEEIMNYVFNNTNIPHTHYMSAILDLKEAINKLLSKAITLFSEETDVEVRKRIFAYQLFRRYINLVIKEIVTYNNHILDDKYSELNANLLAFTKFFLCRGYSVKFYTTNYDNLIPQVLAKHIKIYEGLSTSNVPSISKHWDFNYDLNRFRMARVSHFNLHGSIFLKKQWNDDAIIYQTLYDESSQEMPDFASIEDHGNPSQKLFFSPIITGYNKTQRTVNNPFNLGFSTFINDLNDCKALITVGYSFHDPHINSMLSSFTGWNKAKFLNVNQMNKNFDSSGVDYFFNETVKRIYKKQEDKIWLFDTTDRKFIYKDGFSNFLKDSSNWNVIL